MPTIQGLEGTRRSPRALGPGAGERNLPQRPSGYIRRAAIMISACAQTNTQLLEDAAAIPAQS